MASTRNRKILISVVVLALGVAAVLWFQRPTAPAVDAAASPASAAAPVLTVTLVSPEEAEWPLSIEANGSIAAWQEAVIGAETQGLRLTDVRVQVGDRVRKGDVLALLQRETTGAEVAVTQANLAEAQAAAAQAGANADRARQLAQTGAMSEQQIHEFTTAEQTARARVVALRARLRADEVRLAQTRIVAPDDGVISARIATVGSVVSSGQELFRLIRRGRLEWRAEVASADLARLKPGMTARIVPPGGAPVEGRLRQLAPTVDPGTRNGLVYVDLPEPGDARAGMFARGDFRIGTARGLTLPQGAVVLRDGFSYAFAVDRQGRVGERKLEVGRRLGDRIEVRAGLEAEARVVEQGGGFLADGDLVRVVEALPPAGGAAPADALPAAPAASASTARAPR